MASRAIADRAAGLALFEHGTYPSQLRGGPVAGFHGEYRGYYPEEQVWRPKWSLNGARPGGHRGLDIYAPFALHPLETPIRALASGDIDCRPACLEPDDLGNRIDLHANGVILSYGHLSRFEGRSRKGVEKGDIIGYAGCSGNADVKGECRLCGACNINSGHVHLSVRKGIARPTPIDYYPLKLRFDEGDALHDDLKCPAFVSGHGYPAKWEPAPPVAGPLVGTKALERRRIGGKPDPLRHPFDKLEFDSVGLLERGAGFYRHCAARLGELDRPVTPTTPGDALLKAFLTEKVLNASNALRAETPLKALAGTILKDGAVIGLGPADAAATVPGWLLRHISRLTQMAYLAFGGAALDALGDNGYKNAKCALFNNDEYKKSYLRWRTTRLPESGAAVGGFAWLSATRNARNALQKTMVEITPGVDDGLPAPPASAMQVLSVSFGAGSLTHATVSDHMRVAPGHGTGFSADIETAIGAYIDALGSAANRLIGVHTLCHKHQVLLSNEASSASAQAKRQAALKEVSDAIAATAEGFLACRAMVSEALAPALVRRMAQSNAALFDRLAAIARQTERDDAIGPSFQMLEQRTA